MRQRRRSPSKMPLENSRSSKEPVQIDEIHGNMQFRQTPRMLSSAVRSARRSLSIAPRPPRIIRNFQNDIQRMIFSSIKLYSEWIRHVVAKRINLYAKDRVCARVVVTAGGNDPTYFTLF